MPGKWGDGRASALGFRIRLCTRILLRERLVDPCREFFSEILADN